MSIRRIAGWSLVTVFLLGLLPNPRALAQDQTTASLVLLSQTPWNTPKDPILDIKVHATNTGSGSIGQLSLGVTIWAQVTTRIDYSHSLIEPPSLPTIFATALSEPGTLGPGQGRNLSISVNLSSHVSAFRTSIYPMEVDLRSGTTSLAQVFTPVISYIRKPSLQPLQTQWTVELTAPISYLPDGTFANTDLQDQIAPHTGSLAAEVAALHAVEPSAGGPAIDLVVSPLLIKQLRMMSVGYKVVTGNGTAQVPAGTGGSADAEAILKELRDIVSSPSVELSALPLMDPSVPSLVRAGLQTDLTNQITTGSALLKDALGRAPDANIIRPSGGALDQQTLNVLATSPSSVLLGDSDTLPHSYLPGASAAAGFTPLPTGLAQTSSGLDVPVVLPDPDTQLLLTATPPSGPVAQAQQVLGELLASWQELPSIPRGVALDLPASLPPGIWGQLLPRIGSAPFLKMVNVSDLLAVAPPPATPSRISTETPGLFTGGYMREIKQQSQHIQWLNSMLPPDGTTQTAPLVDDLYAAESSAFVSNEGKGRAFIDQVNAATKRAFMSTKPLPGQEFTFTSRSGTIPLELGDPGDLTLHFMIQLQSNKLIFPEGSTQSITLDHPNQVADFRVEFKGSGLIQVTANVVAPDGRTIRTTTILVRSTAYNKIALLITALAASILVVMWARRIFRRQAS